LVCRRNGLHCIGLRGRVRACGAGVCGLVDLPDVWGVTMDANELEKRVKKLEAEVEVLTKLFNEHMKDPEFEENDSEDFDDNEDLIDELDRDIDEEKETKRKSKRG
jgi:hypothetical protein